MIGEEGEEVVMVVVVVVLGREGDDASRRILGAWIRSMNRGELLLLLFAEDEARTQERERERASRLPGRVKAEKKGAAAAAQNNGSQNTSATALDGALVIRSDDKKIKKSPIAK